MSGGIPKIIHQTYTGYGRIPESFLECVDINKRLNPGWKYAFYTDEDVYDFVHECYGARILRLFNRIHPSYGAARADLFRYLLLYRMGGVYLDIKSRCTRALDAVIQPDDAFVLSRWRNGVGQAHATWGLHPELAHVPGGEFQQWHIIAAPEHPFLAAVIKRVLAGIEAYSVRQMGIGREGVLRLTGPIAYTLAIYPMVTLHPCRIVADETELGLQYSPLPGLSHQREYPTHYLGNTAALVRQPGLRGWLDTAYRLRLSAMGWTSRLRRSRCTVA